MKTLNPELESQVDALAELCCSAIDQRSEDWYAASKPLIQALVTGGYARMSDSNLQTRLEARILEKCRETAVHRRAEILGNRTLLADHHQE